MGARCGIGKGPSATLRQEIHKKLRAIFVLTDADKAALVLALTSAGLSVCNCPTEADLHIAQIMATTPLPAGIASRIAVSGDSDLLVYSTIPSVLRPMPGGKGYAMYHKQHVLDALEFTNAVQLELLGVVCHSDYAEN
ncbi:hypothetical protein BGZ98_006684, partial [Dissophora globulifera]